MSERPESETAEETPGPGSPAPATAGSSSSSPSPGQPHRAGSATRIAAVILSFVLAFVVAVVAVAMLDVADLTPCEDVAALTDLVDGECFEGSAAAKTRTQILGWIGAGFGLLAIIAALNLASTGRGRRTFAALTALTLVFLVLSLAL